MICTFMAVCIGAKADEAATTNHVGLGKRKCTATFANYRSLGFRQVSDVQNMTRNDGMAITDSHHAIR